MSENIPKVKLISNSLYNRKIQSTLICCYSLNNKNDMQIIIFTFESKLPFAFNRKTYERLCCSVSAQYFKHTNTSQQTSHTCTCHTHHCVSKCKIPFSCACILCHACVYVYMYLHEFSKRRS